MLSNDFLSGRTGKKVSSLGYGCLRFPTTEEGKIDRERTNLLIDTAIKGGVNYFDTGVRYHKGEAELYLGEVLSGYQRESYLLTTKLPPWFLKTREDAARIFGESLEKCRVDYFDVYMIHAMSRLYWPAVRETRTLDFLTEMKKQGKARYIGFSFHGDINNLREVLDAYDWDVVQLQINYLDVKAIGAQAFYDELAERGIPCIAMEPLRGGFLANPPEAARSELEAVNDNSPAVWGMRWCMDQKNIKIVLSGMSNMDALRENLATFSEYRPLGAEENAALLRAREKTLALKTIPCSGCRYCMDCSSGVDIPLMFDIYNRYRLFGDAIRAAEDLKDLGGEHNADACIRCGACKPHCPQNIDIPEEVARVMAEVRAAAPNQFISA